MTFEQAAKYRSENRDVRGELYQDDPTFKISYILIAPKDVGFDTRISVLKECLYDIWDNKRALENLHLIDKDMDLYVINDTNGEFKEALFSDHLEHKKPHD